MVVYGRHCVGFPLHILLTLCNPGTFLVCHSGSLAISFFLFFQFVVPSFDFRFVTSECCIRTTELPQQNMF